MQEQINKHNFGQDIEAAQKRLAALQQQVKATGGEAAQEEALIELAIALEELGVAEEELYQQNEELLAARQTLELEHQRYQDLFDFAPGGYLVTDPAGLIREVNRAAALMFQAPQPHLVNKPLVLFVAPKDRRILTTKLVQLQREGKAEGWELSLQLRGAPACYVALTVATKYNDEGKLAGIRWLIRDITAQKVSEAEKTRLLEAVSRQREQLRGLTRRLAEVQEAERKQLSRELHDQVGQNLTGLDLNLYFIRSQLAGQLPATDPVLARLDDSLALVRQTVGSIRNVMADLRPPVLDDYGLIAALEWYAGHFAAHRDVQVAVQGQEPNPRLAAPVETALFRITQEALTNVAKHAQASQVTVILKADEATARLVVADDGPGVELANLAEPARQLGWGLLIMKERAEAVGGHCRFESSPEQGTQVIVEVPR